MKIELFQCDNCGSMCKTQPRDDVRETGIRSQYVAVTFFGVSNHSVVPGATRKTRFEFCSQKCTHSFLKDDLQFEDEK